ncbi:MAG: GTP pyrophosphokinase [Thermodesulfobacteriota bacterium]
MADGQLSPDQLRQRAVRFFGRYGQELEAIRQLLHIRLGQLALAYTLEHGLPRDAVLVISRTKTLGSFLAKLERQGWPQFYLPSEVVQDLVAARVVCWFLDDCYGMLRFAQESQNLLVVPDSVDDYNRQPKPSGYRAIHLLVRVPYDRVAEKDGRHQLVADHLRAEVQIRTKLQDAWGELTHEMHYKMSTPLRQQYDMLVAAMADRLWAEDRSAEAIRQLLRRERPAKHREGLRGS